MLLILVVITAIALPLTAGGATEQATTQDAFGWIESKTINGLPGLTHLK